MRDTDDIREALLYGTGPRAMPPVVDPHPEDNPITRHLSERARLGSIYGFCTICGAHRTTRMTEIDGHAHIEMICSRDESHDV